MYRYVVVSVDEIRHARNISLRNIIVKYGFGWPPILSYHVNYSDIPSNIFSLL